MILVCEHSNNIILRFDNAFVKVPIYNACYFNHDFTTALKRLDRLVRFSEDIPTGSCAVVGYTINTFTRADDSIKSVSFNIQWAMILGMPN